MESICDVLMLIVTRFVRNKFASQEKIFLFFIVNIPCLLFFVLKSRFLVYMEKAWVILFSLWLNLGIYRICMFGVVKTENVCKKIMVDCIWWFGVFKLVRIYVLLRGPHSKRCWRFYALLWAGFDWLVIWSSLTFTYYYSSNDNKISWW